MKGNTLLLVIATFLLICSLLISYNNNRQIKELRQENFFIYERIDSLINLSQATQESTNNQVPDSLSDAVNEAAYTMAEAGKGLFEFFGTIIEGISNEMDKDAGNKTTSVPVCKPKMVVTSKYRMEDRYVEYNGVVLPDLKGSESGQVDLSISIDFFGNVKSAKIKSTTGITNEDVIEACKKAALQTKFNTDQKGYQPGSITYFFKME